MYVQQRVYATRRHGAKKLVLGGYRVSAHTHTCLFIQYFRVCICIFCICVCNTRVHTRMRPQEYRLHGFRVRQGLKEQVATLCVHIISQSHARARSECEFKPIIGIFPDSSQVSMLSRIYNCSYRLGKINLKKMQQLFLLKNRQFKKYIKHIIGTYLCRYEIRINVFNNRGKKCFRNYKDYMEIFVYFYKMNHDFGINCHKYTMMSEQIVLVNQLHLIYTSL